MCDYALSFILSYVSRQRFDHLECIDLILKSGWESIDIVLKLVHVNSYCELSNCQKHVIDPILISAHLEWRSVSFHISVCACVQLYELVLTH